MLALLFVCMEKVGFTCTEKELPKIYAIFGDSQGQGKSASTFQTLENSHRYYTWLWQGKFDEIEEVTDVIKLYPVFFRDISMLNSMSKRLNIQNFEKLDENSVDRKEILLFLNILSAWFKKLAETVQKSSLGSKSQVLKDETKIIAESKKPLLEFLDRVSQSNSKETKNFLIAFLKCLASVYDGKVYNLILGEMAHLYRDSFSFQSILLMNALILSDFPRILDELSEESPLFVVSFVCACSPILGIHLPSDRPSELHVNEPGSDS